jgi:hypothetical protein
MSAKFACNLIATLSQPPWTEELDWSLHTNFDWEKRVPFYAYVQPNRAAPRATEQGSLFPKFGALPMELQLRILALCPANTLFQVMHALPSLRTEAPKLFWTMPNASFLIQASWLLDGGYPGFTYIELSFLQYVKRVEIEYSGYYMPLRRARIHPPTGVDTTLLDESYTEASECRRSCYCPKLDIPKLHGRPRTSRASLANAYSSLSS